MVLCKEVKGIIFKILVGLALGLGEVGCWIVRLGEKNYIVIDVS